MRRLQRKRGWALALTGLLLAATGVLLVLGARTQVRRDAAVAHLQALTQLPREAANPVLPRAARAPSTGSSDTLALLLEIEQEFHEDYTDADIIIDTFRCVLDRGMAAVEEAEWEHLRQAIARRQMFYGKLDRLVHLDPFQPDRFSLRQMLRMYARLLGGRAFLHAHDHNTAGVLEDLENLLLLGELTRADSRLFMRSSQYRIGEIALTTLNVAISPGMLREEESQRVVQLLRDHELGLSLKPALMHEASSGMARFESLRAGETSRKGLGPRLLGGFLSSVAGAPVLHVEESVYAEAMAGLLEAVDRPWHTVWDQVEAHALKTGGAGVANVLTSTGNTYFPHVFYLKTRYTACLQLAQLGLLIEAHAASQGAYPEALEVFAELFEGSVPTDPFTGLPYQYRPTPEGFRLYSSGPAQRSNPSGLELPVGEIAWRGEQFLTGR